MSFKRKLERNAKGKSEFQKSLDATFKKQQDESLTEEQRKEKRYEKLNNIFEQLGDKKNRYFFYCPDIPFACTTVKVIYEYSYYLTKLGYNVTIMHEVKGYKPNWLGNEDVLKTAKVHYLTERRKDGTVTKPTFNFEPTDTIIIPEGFWSVMMGFAEIKTLHKVVLAFGYGGFITAEPGANWALLGFTDVICISDGLKNDYSKLWPNLNYYTTGYVIDTKEFTAVPTKDIKPILALSCRSREDAQSITNIFYAKYPFLDIFQFKILKRLGTTEYKETLQEAACLIFVDEKAGHPAPPLEAIACQTPVISVFGRGMEHLSEQQGIIWVPTSDPFVLVETLAEFCLNWLDHNVKRNLDTTVLNNYTEEIVIDKLRKTFEELQQHKVKLFSAIKSAADESKLDAVTLFKGDERFDNLEKVTTVNEIIKELKE
jgi:hypothetical protein